ncbi:rod-binding protein [Phaeobacter inhibens]|uniref:rod-binding protein n=1 Tax=Phaeobacter inhibens TaxID=221822 RepID=UPI0004109120|nr:rod-binding protein [Phaeobacter inhibens]AUQ56198.1 putative rod-binding protein [Phaeobacter inhibens]AUQ60385.1 putative rod-binding protein [Phaeobacter inhibens]AUQ64492.1 putative rod-binding protein [Phaeobacter inhibens]AUQ72363.1 putative rod-binding protein [Phaeobacter inhibens]AUQ80214.1 putative rod-binding protein [Phaeobacter inhibens]
MEPIAQLTAMRRPAAITPPPQDPLRKAAQELEATFLTEMLKSAGLGESRETMGGGAGEDQFSSFLVRAQAEQITKAGGVGLAESLYHALKEAQDND